MMGKEQKEARHTPNTAPAGRLHGGGQGSTDFIPRASRETLEKSLTVPVPARAHSSHRPQIELQAELKPYLLEVRRDG